MIKTTRRKFIGSTVAAGICSRLAIAREQALRIGVTDWNLNLGANPEAVPLAAKEIASTVPLTTSTPHSVPQAAPELLHSSTAPEHLLGKPGAQCLGAFSRNHESDLPEFLDNIRIIEDRRRLERDPPNDLLRSAGRHDQLVDRSDALVGIDE